MVLGKDRTVAHSTYAYTPDERWIRKIQDLLDGGKITREDVEQLVSYITSAIDHAETEGRYGRD
jgi:ParB-like chromosome segregation protein Spo0J